jgi:monoamine oxidase
MITAWIAGPNVNLIHPAGSTLEKLLPRVLHTLATALGVAPNELKALLRSWHTHDWQADPFAQGAYSYAAAGAVDASAHMAQPVEETLYFAGEHTDTTGHWGTVHGALRSGIRAATQLLASG